MEDDVIDRGMTVVRRVVPRPIRKHAFVSVVVAGALIGGGLRFVPTSNAAPDGTDAGGSSGAASTACAAS